MVEEKVTLKNEEGLHARTAAKFLQNAVKFKSDIILTKDEKEYDGKSILSILSMAAFKDDEIVISCEGEDEKEALDCLVDFVNNK
ncbi:HPr family phosphocarrier protein [Lagierella massiliensis]|uniref:HPr family phosphocarrier protein n=1 Tax=Lagierella massiliensis TaxID=1689303 RepID=UPI0006D845ED|nr:HPr family phosphocarrier protein [Lagierella massiliensis]